MIWSYFDWVYFIFVFFRLAVFAFQLTVMYSDIIKQFTRLIGLLCGREINIALMILVFIVGSHIEWFGLEADHLAGFVSYVMLYTFKVRFGGRTWRIRMTLDNDLTKRQFVFRLSAVERWTLNAECWRWTLTLTTERSSAVCCSRRSQRTPVLHDMWVIRDSVRAIERRRDVFVLRGVFFINTLKIVSLFLNVVLICFLDICLTRK